MHSDSLPIDRAAINRANSLKSTGPRTDAGKQKSSLNALRHGLTGHVIVMPSEDLAAYEAFAQRFHDDFQPATAVETHLVQALAEDSWRLSRARAMENNLLTLGLDSKFGSIVTENDQVRGALSMALSLGDQTKALSMLSLHQQRISRTFEKTLTKLEEIQAKRRAIEKEQLFVVGRLYEIHAAEVEAAQAAGEEAPPPFDPSAGGFVFSIDQIKANVLRLQLIDTSYGYPNRHSAAA